MVAKPLLPDEVAAVHKESSFARIGLETVLIVLGSSLVVIIVALPVGIVEQTVEHDAARCGMEEREVCVILDVVVGGRVEGCLSMRIGIDAEAVPCAVAGSDGVG